MARWVRQAGISQQCVCCVLSQRESFWVECGLDPIEPFRVRVVLTPNPLVWCGEFVVFLHFMNPCWTWTGTTYDRNYLVAFTVSATA